MVYILSTVKTGNTYNFSFVLTTFFISFPRCSIFEVMFIFVFHMSFFFRFLICAFISLFLVKIVSSIFHLSAYRFLCFPFFCVFRFVFFVFALFLLRLVFAVFRSFVFEVLWSYSFHDSASRVTFACKAISSEARHV